MKITMTTIIERQRARIYTKSKKLRNIFIYKKPDTFQKARQFPLRFYIQKTLHLTLLDFDEIFEVGIYIQKASHFALHDVLIYKKLDTSQKARQFPLRFYIQKARHIRYAIFHKNFEVGIYIQKSSHFALRDVFLYKKQDTSQKARQFAIRFYIQKSGTFALLDFSLNF